ncbi:coniferyl aldehyde dehydrogenase [Mycolicibacterium phlei]|jgi:coniferyl-aldehyde dehydrogenase|uniref:coniferyl aldehyde dehydrogenase n=1 Tax=Mycolicibacterium phlei TaxID=1771 RepID=UPI00025ADDEF|nr:coniferyl aldehyde dehydrogenase [Mycolicibacterium phlei]EID15260.1 NAD-dependent aldehyde dehydrogenase [Mycolicibacterium phlei RIVM601174]
MSESTIQAGLPGVDDAMRRTLERQRRAFIADGPPSVAVRRERIDRLVALVLENSDALVDAVAADYGTRPRDAVLFTEILGMMSVIEHTRTHVPQWMRTTKLMRAARLFGLRAEVQPSPLGVVGIIGPWNFPINLVVLPAAAAFAAGNRVMIKMSEITPRTAELMKSLAHNYFDVTELDVVTGGPDVAAAFASLPFDHLFFTGSPSVGARVQRAAAENLVPVTLELGGKNPVVVSPRADLGRAAERIARSRMINGGQVCVCPDYVFVPEDGVEAFVAAAKDTLRQMFPTILNNGDYCSSVNEANYDRVVALIDDARAKGATVEPVAPPGELLPNRPARKIAPTIVRGVDERMTIAAEEVFGPVLDVRGYRDLDAVIDYINERPSPLVAYWYGPDDADFRRFVRHTRSGGVARNDFAAQMIPSAAPFGGVGRSGMGAYHGKAGFDAFSHYRTVVGTDLPFTITGRAAPPFSASLRAGTALGLRMARRRTQRRLRHRSRSAG